MTRKSAAVAGAAVSRRESRADSATWSGGVPGRDQERQAG
jgi:hypothetical protein